MFVWQHQQEVTNTMFRVIVLQLVASIIIVMIAGVLVGTRGMISAGVASVACVLPNLFFVLRLQLVVKRAEAGSSYAKNFFIGEFLKVAATIGLLAIAIKGYPEMHWPSMLIGLVVVLHAGFIVFWKKS